LKPLTIVIFMAMAIILAASGQIALKVGMQKFGALGSPGLGMASKVVSAVFTLPVLLGLAMYGVGACLWLVVIAPGGWALSYAYPMVAISYVVVVLLSRVCLKEAVTPVQE
jgi:hypothetical protein